MRKQRVTSKNHDIAGCRITRVLKQNLLFRVMPIGNFGGGPDLKIIAKLCCMHALAGIYYAVKIRLGRLASAFVFRR